MLFPLVTIVAQRHSPPEQVGVGTALPVMLRSLGGALGVAWLGQMLHRSMAERAAAGLASALHATEALAAATGWVFVWATAAALVASIVALALPARPGVAEPARASA